ncbi:permease [Thermohalobacter berrensis]|uniref:Fe-S cluster protein n=1 Tax=Thermohalobacter berrensis TaxID=99594 RepID=A0A419T2Z8_9FIRM|nr:permease [Thermohalobacter berrensis]RKD31924.1 Fe-S cluster protein [Thermohalobacter berrensis]
MISTSSIKKHRLKIVTVILYLFTLVVNSEIFFTAIKTTAGYLKEMFQILPAVFIISGLITVWVPKEVIIKNFGKESGLKGKLISVFIGSISAGPIYAAFPVAFSLLGKGASISNIVIIISSWAVVKVPMMIVESKFIGFQFMIIRGILTVPAIIFIGYMVEKLIDKQEIIKDNGKEAKESNLVIKVENRLPQYNCGGCGYDSCRKFAEAIVKGETKLEKCSISSEELRKKITNILNNNRQIELTN